MNFYLMFMWNAKHVKASVLTGNSRDLIQRKVYFRCFEHDRRWSWFHFWNDPKDL
jgi:hypothetical protein